MAAESAEFPAIRREPYVLEPGRFTTVPVIQAVLDDVIFGRFWWGAQLVEDMLRNPRMRSVVGTRLAGLVAADIRWEQGRGRAARRAVRDIVEDWPLMMPGPVRKQLHKWGLLLGVGFGQRNWTRERSGRLVPRLQVYHPQHVQWAWSEQVYRITTADGVFQDKTVSPALSTDDSPDSPWVVHEPFGQRSWREGYIQAAWYPWLGHGKASRDANRSSEKYGKEILLLGYPAGSKDVDQVAANIRRTNGEGVIPLPKYAPTDTQPTAPASWTLEPLNITSVGYEIINATRGACATDLAVLLLGHNLTTEVKGGSFAAANVGEYIRDDLKDDDAQAEWATVSRQLVRRWAEINYGDPDAAPKAVYVTDPPGTNKLFADTLAALGNAAENLKRAGVDVPALMQLFRAPMAAAKPSPEPALNGVPELETEPAAALVTF